MTYHLFVFNKQKQPNQVHDSLVSILFPRESPESLSRYRGNLAIRNSVFAYTVGFFLILILILQYILRKSHGTILLPLLCKTLILIACCEISKIFNMQCGNVE